FAYLSKLIGECRLASLTPENVGRRARDQGADQLSEKPFRCFSHHLPFAAIETPALFLPNRRKLSPHCKPRRIVVVTYLSTPPTLLALLYCFPRQRRHVQAIRSPTVRCLNCSLPA